MIAQAPVIFCIAIVIIGSALWAAMHWRYGGQISLLKEQIASYKMKLEMGDKNQQIISIASDWFGVEHYESTWYWRIGQTEQQPIVPKIEAPNSAVKVLVEEVKIFAPLVPIESIQLEIMGERIPSSNWEPMQMGIVSSMYVDFIIPNSINSGIYTVRLVARNRDREIFSSPFTLEVPQLKRQRQG